VDFFTTLLNEQVAFIKKQRDKTLISLNLNTYRQEEENSRTENKRFEEISKLSTSLVIAALSDDITEMKGDTAKIARSDKWIKDLTKDIFLEEAVKVIGDMR
jgi:carboxyl-terminal processing protease